MRWSTDEDWKKHCLIGVATALAVSWCTALMDWFVLTQTSVGAEVPGRVMLGTVGRVLSTHAISVLPLALLVTLLIGALAARLRLARVEGLQVAACVLIAGILVGYGSIAQKDGMPLGPVNLTATHMVIVTVFCTLVAGGAIHLVGRTRWRARYLGLLAVTATIGLLLFVSAPFLLRGTPLAGPAAYRAPSLAGTDHASRPAGPPNVLFIVLDTVRADRLSHHGHSRDTTPFLAELAEKSVTFDRAIAPGNHTYPSHASMFTGLAVREHGFGGEREINRLDGQFETFAERAHAAGYQTKAFSCNPWVDHAQNLLQGFESTVGVWGTWQWSNSFLHHWLFRCGAVWPVDWVEVDCGAAMLNCLVADWIAEDYRPDAPFLLFFNYMEGHRDHRPPRAYRELFLDEAGLQRSYELERDADVLVAADSDYWFVPPDAVAESDLEISLALYDASLRYQDDRLRELLGLFEQGGLLGNTVVFIVSDHGEGFGEHGIFQHHSCVYDILVRVPLTIHVPRFPIAGRRVSAAVSTIFLHDAVCAAISGDVAYDAEALAELIVERSSERSVVTESPMTTPMAELRAPAFGIEPGTGILRTFHAICDERLKYILASDGQEELYDVTSDPEELHDLAAEQPDLLAPFSKAMQAWLEATQPKHGSGASEAAELDPRQRAMIKSLGYTDE